jgi:hypothetical protein
VSLEQAPIVASKVRVKSVKENSAVVARLDEKIKSLDQGSSLISDLAINRTSHIEITEGKGGVFYITSYLHIEQFAGEVHTWLCFSEHDLTSSGNISPTKPIKRVKMVPKTSDRTLTMNPASAI